MDVFYTAFQNFMLKFCIASLALLFAAWLLVVCRKQLDFVFEKFRRLPMFEQMLVATMTLCMCLYGGSKNRVYYDGGIKADTSNQNVVTNDLVQVYWAKEASAILPNDAPVYIDYRLTDTTNEWVNIGQSTVSAGYWSGTVVNATNYDYQVWAYYIPPEPVHTNGVWSYSTMRDINEIGIIPLRADVEVNGKTIVEPIKYRREQE